MNAILLGIALQMIRESGDPDLFQHKNANLDWRSVLEPGDMGVNPLAALQQTHVGIDVKVPVADGKKRYVNFDGAASTPSFEPIWESFCTALQLPDDDQLKLVAAALQILRNFFGASASEFDFVFACNATEAVNYAARNLAAKDFGDVQLVVVNTLLEHHSNELPWRMLPGFNLVRTDVDENGFVDLLRLETLLKAYNQECLYGQQRIVLVAFSGASNVLGTLNPLEKIAKICHRYNVQCLVDGAQLSAHRAVDLAASGVDYYAFSAHKMCSPFGSGGLFIRRGSHHLIEEVCMNGFANAAGVAALAKSTVLLALIGFERIEAYERDLTTRALTVLSEFRGIQIYGMSDPSGPEFKDKGPVIVFEMKGFPHNLLAKYLADYGGIGTRNGCFCAHMLVSGRMGIESWRPVAAKAIIEHKGNWFLPLLPGMVRVSFGIENAADDIDRLRQALEMIEKIRLGPINRWLAKVHEGTWILPKSGAEKAIASFVDHQVGKVFP
jgi:selenocysteine lyase/cysteine desulfurase